MSELRFESWLCYAHGESDLPQARFCRTPADMREFLVDEWFGDPKDPELDDLMEELNTHDWSEGAWTIKFEIGGVKIEKVWACTPTHGALPVSPEVQRTAEQIELERWKKAYRDMELLATNQCLELTLLKKAAVAGAAARPDGGGHEEAGYAKLVWRDEQDRRCTTFITNEQAKEIAQPTTAADDARDARRYRHMRNNAVFQSYHGPRLYWYLPRHGDGDEGQRLDATIDAAIDAAGNKT